MPTIIYPRTLPWNWMVQRPQQILKELSFLGYTVLYEDVGSFREIQVKKLWDSFYLCRGISPLSLAHPRPRILWLTFPQHVNLIDIYQPDAVIFDCSDEAREEFSAWGPYIKPVLTRAKLVFATSQNLFDLLSSQHPRVTLLRNGVDYAHFSTPQERPEDLPKEQPLIGYSGAIAPWLDWDLLEEVISKHPDFNFVFLGALVRLKHFPITAPNVSYLGQKPYAKLPGYLQRFKVSLIPFKHTPMTHGCNPIKLYEYAAVGSPIVTTPLPELLEAHSYITSDSEATLGSTLTPASTPQTFSQGIEEALLRGADRGALQTFAVNNTWQNRAKEIDKKILALGLDTG